MKYARNVNNTAVDVTTTDPTTIYYPTVAAEFIVVPTDVEDGWLYNDGNKKWSEPPPPPEPVPMVVIPPTISAVAFRNLFSIDEEIAISTSTDSVIKVLWDRFCDPKLNNVDMSLASVSTALDYLTTKTILAAGRKDQILTGVPI